MTELGQDEKEVTIELELCPFCGGAEAEYYTRTECKHSADIYGAFCCSCERMVTSGKSQEDVTKQWNTLSRIMQELSKDDENVTQWGTVLEDASGKMSRPNLECALFCCKLTGKTLTIFAANNSEFLEENKLLKLRIAELESLSSGCSNALHKQNYLVTSHKELMLEAAEKLASKCGDDGSNTVTECLSCDVPTSEFYCGIGTLVKKLHQAATGDCPIAMGRLNEAKELFKQNNDTWCRVGDLEVAPVEMWKRVEWDDGRILCQSLECFMPDQEQLQMILEDDAIRALIDKKRLIGKLFWSSSEHDSDHAWVQRPRDGYQLNDVKCDDCWIIPCRKADGQ